MSTTTDRLAALPEPLQEQLLRIAHTAAGMSESEKVWATCFYAGIVSQHAVRGDSDGVEAVTIISAAMRIVNEIHGLAGGTQRPTVVI